MRIHPLDLVIVIAYLLGVTLLGLRFRQQQHNINDYFLGGRSTPWWALALSIVATETSTLTIIGTPAIAYTSNLTFLQLVFGYIVGRFLISLLFLPGYFRGEFLTAYALIEKRFGAKMRAVAALTFLGTRTLAEGVRVSAIALVVSVALGTSERLAVFIVIALTILYTFEGGMKAVIWTDVAQFLLYLTGSLITVGLLLHKIPGGWTEVTQVPGFLLEPQQDLHLLVRSDWRRLSHHGHARHRPNHRAAPSRCAQSKRQPPRHSRQWLHRSFPIHRVPSHRCNAFCVCAALASACAR
jgi:Na+/proline symporter